MCSAWQAPSCICLTFEKGSLGMLVPPVTLSVLGHQHQVNMGNFSLGTDTLFLWPWPPPLCRCCIAVLDTSWMLWRSSQRICKCRVLMLAFPVRNGAGSGTIHRSITRKRISQLKGLPMKPAPGDNPGMCSTGTKQSSWDCPVACTALLDHPALLVGVVV